jgi:hypothetical protein
VYSSLYYLFSIKLTISESVLKIMFNFFFIELKLEIEKAELGEYLDEFEEGVKDEVVMLGQISLEEVQEEEKRLRDEHIE